MQQANSITTSQTDIHDKLLLLVERHKTSEYKRPIQEHNQAVFDDMLTWLQGWQGELVLDSCCGVGESTVALAARFPNARIIGVDKSAARLAKHHAYQSDTDNYRVWRTDVHDFWRLCTKHSLFFDEHFLLYPNPYPKPSQVQKRWYASAVMPDLMTLSERIHVRSNWQLYLREFSAAAACYGYSGSVQIVPLNEPFTPFERKYAASMQTCYSLTLERAK